MLALLHAPALAASGKALGVDPAAEARHAAVVRTLTVGDDVSIGERIVTGATGQVQIMFDDQTELVIGPSSSLVIEDYLLRNDGSAGKLAINALAGTFRFVTGGAPKDRYTIKTPTGTIGVRGTAFELYVTSLWSYVLMQHGSVIGCNEVNECIVTEAQCEVAQLSASEAILVGPTNRLSSQDRAALRQMFIYANNQKPLLQEFRINQAERCLRLPPPPPPAASLIEPGSASKPHLLQTPPPPPDDDPVWNPDTGCWEYSDGQDDYCI